MGNDVVPYSSDSLQNISPVTDSEPILRPAEHHPSTVFSSASPSTQSSGKLHLSARSSNPPTGTLT
jgi:hypothetical protein